MTILLFLLLNSASHALTLDEAFHSALEKNETARQAREHSVQAEERYKQARAAPLPTLTYDFAHTIQPLPNDPFARQFFPEKSTTSNLTLSQPLFRGFREFAGLRNRKALMYSERHKEIADLAKLYAEVTETYLGVLSLEQDVKNLNEQLAVYAQRSKDLSGRSGRGESRRDEALTARATEASTEANLRIVEAQLRSARQNLSYMTGQPPESPLAEPPVDDGKRLMPLDHYLSRIEKRPDIQSAIEVENAEREMVRFNRGSHWPTADVQGRYYFTRPDGFTKDLDWDVEFRLKWPLFEGGLRLAETREAASKHREAQLELARLRRYAQSEVRSLYDNYKMRAQQVAALKRSSELAQQSAQSLQGQFRRGLTRNIDVQYALTEWAFAKRSYDQARFLAGVDRVKLENAAAIYPAPIKERRQ